MSVCKAENREFVQNNSDFSWLENKSELRSKQPILTKPFNVMSRTIEDNTFEQLHKKEESKKNL